MAYSLSNKCAKTFCKRTVLVQLIRQRRCHMFFGTQCMHGKLTKFATPISVDEKLLEILHGMC